ncbi:hypothetical protein MUN76_02380 [Leucobacter rhizosphaerae]|uniref:Solute-binding protein family 3/N-terminal domain-containing protein n=1 Tax=Leucobacter rhizosphaerae TaxID=2932245 RepID=A0ABY4FX29_9MICO|nr:hypothetical protein [Leucobacter rhizosphaerae]UOQ60851.1 hypothetical protein MUN76_02380 [Leucobacter rhizosphaerae]
MARLRVRSRAAGVVGSVILLGTITACGLQIPSDPDGTLSDVAGGTLRVGVSTEPGVITASGDTFDGPAADLVDGLADELGAEVEWHPLGEESIVRMLEDDALDLGVGGFTDATPWIDRAGVSRAFDHLPDLEGRRFVVLVQLGENAFLSRVEAFLDAESGS